jgi:hypothetical protein
VRRLVGQAEPAQLHARGHHDGRLAGAHRVKQPVALTPSFDCVVVALLGVVVASCSPAGAEDWERSTHTMPARTSTIAMPMMSIAVKGFEFFWGSIYPEDTPSRAGAQNLTSMPGAGTRAR